MIQYVLLRAQIWKWGVGYRNLASHSCRRVKSKPVSTNPINSDSFLIIQNFSKMARQIYFAKNMTTLEDTIFVEIKNGNQASQK